VWPSDFPGGGGIPGHLGSCDLLEVEVFDGLFEGALELLHRFEAAA